MIFQKLRRELRGRLGLWAAVFQSRQSSSCGARMLARHSWVNQGDKSLRLLGGSHGKCHRKTRHPPGVSVRKHHRRSQESSQPCRSMCQVTAPGLSSAGSGGNLLQQQGETPPSSRAEGHLFLHGLESNPGSSLHHGLLQARILKWVAIPISMGSS